MRKQFARLAAVAAVGFVAVGGVFGTSAAATPGGNAEGIGVRTVAEVLADVAKVKPGSQRSASPDVSANAGAPVVVIENVSSGGCFDVVNGSGANGADIQQYDCVGVGQQRFRFLTPDQPWSALQAVHSGKCLDIRGGSLANGAQLQQYDCVPGVSAQQFTLVEQGNWSVAIVPRAARDANPLRPKCLDVRGGSLSNGAVIQQWSCATTRDDNADVIGAQQFNIW